MGLRVSCLYEGALRFADMSERSVLSAPSHSHALASARASV